MCANLLRDFVAIKWFRYAAAGGAVDINIPHRHESNVSDASEIHLDISAAIPDSDPRKQKFSAQLATFHEQGFISAHGEEKVLAALEKEDGDLTRAINLLI